MPYGMHTCHAEIDMIPQGGAHVSAALRVKRGLSPAAAYAVLAPQRWRSSFIIQINTYAQVLAHGRLVSHEAHKAHEVPQRAAPSPRYENVSA